MSLKSEMRNPEEGRMSELETAASRTRSVFDCSHWSRQAKKWQLLFAGLLLLTFSLQISMFAMK